MFSTTLLPCSGKLLVTMFALMTATFTIAEQLLNNPVEFKIAIEKSGSEIKMNCEKGCSWIELTYTNNILAQAIDNSGMTEVNDNSSDDTTSPKFLFTISTTKDGVKLNGLKGMAWAELNFTAFQGEKIWFDQFGMTGE